MVTLDQLSNIYTNTDDSVLATFVEPINKVISKFQIDSVAMFLAQMGHESNGLSILEENLNYRADRLSAVFPRYFLMLILRIMHTIQKKLPIEYMPIAWEMATKILVMDGNFMDVALFN